MTSRGCAWLLLLCSALTATGSAEAATPTRLVTLGTSLSARGDWQSLLGGALSHCLGGPPVIDIVARNGANSDWGRLTMPEVLRLAPDILIVEFAANDAALHRGVSRSRSRENLAEIVKQTRQLARPARIFLMAMNPVSGWRGWLRPFLNDYTDMHRRLAAELGVGFIDLRPAWRALAPAETARLVPDGIHPTPAAAGLVTVPAMMAVLEPALCSAQ